MTRRHKWVRLLGVGALAAVLSLVAAGCGGGGNKSSSGNNNAGNAGGKTYPVLRIVLDAPDYMDPQLYYTVEAYQWANYVWTGLMGYTHKSGPQGAQLKPYLAESMPTISADGKDYKFTLRPNLKFSNGKPVRASDFKYSIERAFKVDSPGVGFFEQIKGVGGPNGFAETKKGHIAGIITNDAKRTIEIQLDQPRGDFLYILALEFAHVVPTGTPNSDQSTHPIPSTGPYMVKSYVPNRSFELVRNPYFKGQIPTMPKGAPDRLVAKIVADPVASYQQVVTGKADFDFNQVPNDRLPEATDKYKDQLRIFTNANTYYFALNNKLPPFNNIDARRAVQYGIDRAAIVSGIYGGLAKTTQNFLPPGYPQYKKINEYTFDLAKAKQLVQKSGTAGQTVDVYGPNSGHSKEVTEYLAGQLQKIGYKAKLHLLGDQVYFQTIGNQATKAQAMFTDWYQDYPHPLDWFDVLLNGNRITQTHNNNVGNVDVASVDKEIESLKKVSELSQSVNDRWAKVDRDLIVTYSTTVPYLNLSGTNFFSKDMDMSCYSFHVVVYWDWGVSCKK